LRGEDKGEGEKEMTTEHKPTVPATHPVGIFDAEHKIVLKNLTDLQGILYRLTRAKTYDDISGDVKQLGEIASLLLETESHHKREEEALFPRLEKHGVEGPPRVMRMEHDELRLRKRRLAELVKQAGKIDFKEFVSGVQEAGGYITVHLRGHIYKEDTILYPKALETLGQEEWQEIEKEFDRIGYCPFTPGKEKK
jgi:hypothetical protein